MSLRVHTNQIWLRVLGTLTGVGFLAIGLFALEGSFDYQGVIAERAFGFGLAALLAGLWAVLVSWLDGDLTGVWCRAPNRGAIRTRSGDRIAGEAQRQEQAKERRKQP